VKKSDFYYDLPEELIAQTPIDRREQSRLLCIERDSGKTSHRRFFELPGLLRAGDCLVLNDSRVMPARLIGTRESGGAAEVLLLRETPAPSPGEPSLKPAEGELHPALCSDSPAEGGKTVFECLVRPGRKIRIGTRLVFGAGELEAIVTGETDGGNRLIEFRCDGSFRDMLERLGKTPLPPYIHTELEDSGRYQTVYARETGSAAAPTAGLHFTDELLGAIRTHGADICFMTLHVGLGTFRPVKADTIEKHKMHAEYFTIPVETAEKVNSVKESGGRVIAVGTTSCRALESCANETGRISPFSGFTDIFIYPGYRFRCIDGLITNFHLPESTLIMLVSAFAGRDNTLRAYREAIDRQYRFFSFGDACFIV